MKNSNGNNGSKATARTVYLVKDREGNVRFKGTAKEISKLFGIREVSVHAYHYTTDRYLKEFTIEREKSKDETYEYLIKHIVEYGNTCLSGVNEKRVKKYIEMLKERDGIECTYKRIKYKEDSGAWYIIERRKEDV